MQIDTEWSIILRSVTNVNTLQWRHNGRDGVSNHQPHECLLNCLFRRRSKKTSKLRVTGLCEGNLSMTGEFPAQKASNAENVSIWWRLMIWKDLKARSYCVTAIQLKRLIFWYPAILVTLIQWGQVTHIFVSKLIIIGSDSGLPSGRHQVIIWTNAGILLIRTLGTNFSENLSEISTSSFKKMHLKMSSGKCRTFCLGLNVVMKLT